MFVSLGAMEASLAFESPRSRSGTAASAIWFGIIERQAIHRGTFGSVRDLTTAIRTYINGWNNRAPHSSGPKPGQWREWVLKDPDIGFRELCLGLPRSSE